MILVDTSIWIDVLRGADTRAAHEVTELVRRSPGAVATTEPVQMELLAGAISSSELSAVQGLNASLVLLRAEPTIDVTDAAHLYRSARARGVTVRKLADCLIAAIALRHGAEVWHKDADFEAIAAVCALNTVDLR